MNKSNVSQECFDAVLTVSDVRIFNVPVTGHVNSRSGQSVVCESRAILVLMCTNEDGWFVRSICELSGFDAYVEQEAIRMRSGLIRSAIAGVMRPKSFSAYLQAQRLMSVTGTAVSLRALGVICYGWSQEEQLLMGPEFSAGLTLLPIDGAFYMGREIRKNIDVIYMVSEALSIKHSMSQARKPGSGCYWARPFIDTKVRPSRFKVSDKKAVNF